MRRYLAPALLIAALLCAWQLAAKWGVIADALSIKPYLVPAPSAVASSLWHDRSLLADQGLVTFKEVLLGFGLSVILGFSFAVVLHLSDTLRRASYPLIVASQTIPIIAIAPILVVWFGFGIGPKLAIIALVCFFPITVNTLDGLGSVDPELPKLMRTLDAGRRQVLTRVEIPSALPQFFSGAKVAVAIATIAAVFGEWAGSDSGLGHLLLEANSQLETARLFATISVLSAFAILLFIAVGTDRAAGRVVGATMRRLTIALCVAAAAFAAGCGEKSESGKPGGPDRLTLALDFYVNADHAGIYDALDSGYFADAGLEVKPEVPSDPSAPIREVAAGRVDLAVSYEPEVLLARDQGLPVKAVAALVPSPLTSLISIRKAGIRSIADLAGKTVVTAGIPYQQAYLDSILARAGLTSSDVHTVDVQQSLLPAVTSGRADAMLGGFLNVEGVDLRLRGDHPRVVPVDRLGIPTYDELVLVASTDRLASDPRPIQLFIAALDRELGPPRPTPPAPPKRSWMPVRASTRASRAPRSAAPCRCWPSAGPASPSATWTPRSGSAFAHFFANSGVIQTVPQISDVLTNDLLPGKVP